MEKRGNEPISLARSNLYSNYSQTSCQVRDNKRSLDKFHDALPACSYLLSLSTNFTYHSMNTDANCPVQVSFVLASIVYLHWRMTALSSGLQLTTSCGLKIVAVNIAVVLAM